MDDPTAGGEPVPQAQAMHLAAVAETQAGVFSYRQARTAGYSADRIRRRVTSGVWVKLYGGLVLRAAETRMSAASWSHAAVLATGARSVLAGPSASRLHGIDMRWREPCVLVPTTSRREPPGITILRTPLPDEDCCLVGDLLVTTRPRTVVDCLVLLSEPDGRTFLDRALQLRWTTLDDLALRTQLLAGRRGAPRLRRQLRVASLGVRSEGERVLRRLLRRAGITGWVVDHPVAGVGVLDFAFLAERLALEVDGRAWHSASDRFQRDRTRQNAAVARGWTVLRFTWEDLTERPDQVVGTVRATLARLRVAS